MFVNKGQVPIPCIIWRVLVIRDLGGRCQLRIVDVRLVNLIKGTLHEHKTIGEHASVKGVNIKRKILGDNRKFTKQPSFASENIQFGRKATSLPVDVLTPWTLTCLDRPSALVVPSIFISYHGQWMKYRVSHIPCLSYKQFKLRASSSTRFFYGYNQSSETQ